MHIQAIPRDVTKTIQDSTSRKDFKIDVGEGFYILVLKSYAKDDSALQKLQWVKTASLTSIHGNQFMEPQFERNHCFVKLTSLLITSNPTLSSFQDIHKETNSFTPNKSQIFKW